MEVNILTSSRTIKITRSKSSPCSVFRIKERIIIRKKRIMDMDKNKIVTTKPLVKKRETEINKIKTFINVLY